MSGVYEQKIAFLWAASTGNNDGVDLLLKAGADPNSVVNYESALILAAKNGHT